MWWDDRLKELKCQGSTGMVHIHHNTRFEDIRNLNRCNHHADVVINLLGPRNFFNLGIDNFKKVNIEYPRNIARSARLSGVKKFIHFSACGAEKDSPSMDLRTKYVGEQVVRDEFPDAIIIRPTNVLSKNDNYLQYFVHLMDHWTSFIPVYDDCKALKQPIIVHDLVEAVVNAIQIEGIEGQTFELGGPHVYNQLEILEMIMTAINRKVTLAHVNRNLALFISNYFGVKVFNREDIIKSSLDLIVKQEDGVKGIHDLKVQPGKIRPFINAHCYHYKDPIAATKEQLEY